MNEYSITRLKLSSAALAGFHISRRFQRITNRRIIAVFVLAVVLVTTGQAQTTPIDELEGIPSYSYAIFTGTGFYKLNDRRLLVLRAPFSWRIRDREPETGQMSIKLLLPMALGITDFEKISDIPELDVDSLATLSFVPGVELEFPVTVEWAIKPFIQAGLGWDLKSSAHTAIWGGGLRTRYQPRIGDSSNWTFGGEFLAAGNNPGNDAPNTRFNRFGIGAEHRLPLSGSIMNRKVSIHTQLLGYYYLNDQDFLPPHERIELNHSIEVGVSAGIEPAARILGVNEVIKLGYGDGL